LIDNWGWRSVLAVNLPLAICCFFLGSAYLPRPTHILSDPTHRDYFDFFGAALFSVCLISTAFLLVTTRLAWLDRVWLIMADIIAATVFIWHELRCMFPFINVRALVGNAPLLTTYIRTVLAGVVSYAYIYGFAQ
jgi:hypothetical protein